MRGLGVIVTTLLLSACIPVSHWHYFAPRVTGTVTIGGLPVAGAELVLSDGHKTATASTDSAGHFNIGPLRTYEVTTWLIGDPLYGYSLALRVAGSEYPGMTAFHSGYAPARLELTCDIAKPSPVCTTYSAHP